MPPFPAPTRWRTARMSVSPWAGPRESPIRPAASATVARKWFDVRRVELSSLGASSQRPPIVASFPTGEFHA